MIFPIWWTEDGACACPAGVECNSPGKHPLTPNGVKDATADAARIAEWRKRWPLANWANATGAEAGIFVVDLDVKPGKNGVEAMRAIASPHGGIPQTRVARTGSGGLHLYFRYPTDRKVGNTQNVPAPGIDCRGVAGYVVAPGSEHVSGGRYSWINDCEIAAAPEWLLDAVTRKPRAEAEEPKFPPASAEALAQARAALEKHGPAVEGDGGDNHTFRAAAILTHDFALTEAEALPLLKDWNDTCQPPWDAAALRAKLRGGRKYGTAPYGCRRSVDAVETAKKLIADWDGSDETMFAMIDRVRPLAELCGDPAKRAVIERELKAATGLGSQALSLPKTYLRAERTDVTERPYDFECSATGAPLMTLSNVAHVLETDKVPLYYDTFRQQVVDEAGRMWGDSEILALTMDLQRRALKQVTTSAVAEGVSAYARHRPRNCVSDFIHSVTWDGKPRIDRLLVDGFGAADTEYARAASSNLVKSMVARAEEPGCKVDTAVILEGTQGIRKSTGVATLAHPWFAESSTSPDSKDFYVSLQGRWVVEISEMDSFSKADVASVKRVLSCRSDTYRAPYDKVARDWPRQCVFIGTTNTDEYLKDASGGRRFWPIRCGQVDLAYIKDNRAQMFAEALHRLNKGESWWLMPESAREEQESRYMSDEWEAQIADYLVGKPQTSVADVLGECFNLLPADMGRGEQMRVAGILRRLGWAKVDGRIDGSKRKFWVYSLDSSRPQK